MLSVLSCGDPDVCDFIFGFRFPEGISDKAIKKKAGKNEEIQIKQQGTPG